MKRGALGWIGGIAVFTAVCAGYSKPAAPPTPPPALPAVTGSYEVGTSIFHLADTSRKDAREGRPDRFREFTVQVWYPAEITKRMASAPYLPEPALLAAMKKEKYLNLSVPVLESWRDVRTHSFLDAPIVPSPRRRPLLLFSPGFSVARSSYTSIVEEL